MPRLRNGDVIVITGASSGIGRAIAIAFAAGERKPRLVLAARTSGKLQQVAQECENLGAQTLVVETDVSDPDQVEKLSARAIQAFSTIDVWVSNAGISAVGDFTEVPLKDHQDVLLTNLGGTIAGAYAALKIFKARQRGTLIHIASVNSEIAVPGLSSYVTSKFAIRGLTHSLRQDLRLKGMRDIHVCQVNPSVTDTPAFKNSKNSTGREVDLRIPKVRPEDVAKAVVRLVNRPRREVYVGPLSRIGSFAYTLCPDVVGAIVTWLMKRFYFKDD